jgi:hypothetical protein
MSCLLVFCYSVKAQSQTPDDSRSAFTKGKYNLEVGAGLATYQGDLTEKSTFLDNRVMQLPLAAATTFQTNCRWV